MMSNYCSSFLLVLIFITSCIGDENLGVSHRICHDTSLVGFNNVSKLCEEFIDENLVSRQFYSDTIKFGPFTSYFPNGRVREKGNYVDGHRLGLFKKYDSLGNFRGEAFFINWKAERTILSWFINNKENGKIDTLSSNFYKISIENSDTVSLADSLRFRINYVAPYYGDSVVFVVGNFDEFFNLKDSVGFKTVYPENNLFKVSLPASKVGENYCRGYIIDYNLQAENQEAEPARILHVNFPYYVKG